jgi:hypothetical protein
MATPMRDLRVYVDTPCAGVRGAGESFYTRRADGPYYRWLYEEEVRRWQFTRVSLPKMTLRVLRVAHWEALPSALRARLGEHYLD